VVCETDNDAAVEVDADAEAWWEGVGSGEGRCIKAIQVSSVGYTVGLSFECENVGVWYRH